MVFISIFSDHFVQCESVQSQKVRILNNVKISYAETEEIMKIYDEFVSFILSENKRRVDM